MGDLKFNDVTDYKFSQEFSYYKKWQYISHCTKITSRSQKQCVLKFMLENDEKLQQIF